MFSTPDENGDRWSISLYYFLLQQYDALGPRRSEATAPTPGFPAPPDVAVAHVKDNQVIYETYLRWASIRENIVSNDFETPADMARIDVHYRFLSSYVHPISDRHAATYGRNRPWPQYDQFASELILLYVITLAVREVRSFEAMCGMQPQVVVRDAEEMRRECDHLRARASYL